MARRKIRISTDGNGNGAVEVDDIPLKGVRGFTLTQNVHGHGNLSLDIVVGIVELETDAQVVIPDKSRDALIAIGWTPPPADWPEGAGTQPA
ncbi:hypothetical protein ACWEJ6_44580 [Nonomuraea sp. NPDC004702]